MLVVIRSIFAYLLLLLITRILGRKLMSHMTFFDFSLGIMIGAIAGALAIGSDLNGKSITIALVTTGITAFILDLLYLKSYRVRKFINSEPLVVIENGKIIHQNLKKVRFSIESLLMLLRKQKIFDINDVEFAILETNGKLSVLPKSQKTTVKPSDLGLSTKYKCLMKDIIIDGKIMLENLRDAKLDTNWLYNSLKNQGISSEKQILYAGLNSEGNLYLSRFKNYEETEGVHGIE